MDVHIGKMTSTVRAVDGDSLLTPEIEERLVHRLMARLASEQDRQRRGEEERELRNGRAIHPFAERTGGIA